MRYNSRSGRSYKVLCCASVIALLLCGLFFSFDDKVKANLDTVCSVQSKAEASRLINTGINELIKAEKSDYSSFVELGYAQSGEISSIRTNAASVNRFQTEAANRINAAFSDFNGTVEIPLGNVSGIYTFSGRGPKLKLKIRPDGYAVTELVSEFVSAGINQTMHRIVLDVRVNVSSVMPFYSLESSVNVRCLIAETVIVGEIPIVSIQK